MDQRTYKLRDFAQDVSVAVKDAQSHHLDKFVGLEHYDSGEPVITRYTDTSLITSSVKEFHKNDILIARRNVYLKRAGIAFFDGLTSGDSIILRIFDDSDKRTGIPKEDAVRIIPFVLNSNDFWAYANKHADGMNSKRISKEMLYDYEFSLPSLSEIRQLYSKLWAAYNLKDSYKKLLSATDEMVKSQFIEMFGSNDCESKPLSDLTSLITKGTTPTSVGFNFEEDGIKYIKAENICEDTSINLNDCMHISQDCHNTLKRSQLQNGDILFSIAGVIGRVGVITKECLPANTNQALAIIRFDTSKEINKEYAKYALLSPFVESQWKMKMRGAAQMNISLKDVGDINIPLPSLAKQEQFGQIAEQADKSKFELRKSIEAIDAVIKSLING